MILNFLYIYKIYIKFKKSVLKLLFFLIALFYLVTAEKKQAKMQVMEKQHSNKSSARTPVHIHTYVCADIHTDSHTGTERVTTAQNSAVLQLVKCSLAVNSKSMCVCSQNLVQRCKMPHSACFLNVRIKPKSVFNKIHQFSFQFRSSDQDQNRYPGRSLCSYLPLCLSLTD